MIGKGDYRPPANIAAKRASTPHTFTRGMPMGWDQANKLGKIGEFLFESGSVFKEKPNEKKKHQLIS